ncbi:MULTISPECIES: DNA repair protein RecO [unclassified Neptuniibacter]|jgi:DNA repair protein RecO (recombination protein O)|uniref:DNA repair protein RecO n=1 Tax=unclassified Neptuniibacter TaxID=2630693 RepID=UPI0026E25FD1|nr:MULTISPECIES: DNA repair protein RecO [unclassified Neptuniibacter]MDO6514138.1 DNA repair protein RecO [Neptuniibacter sp. 2_MG-2023]MDO6592739.1 DNA repair protein RecO [Neptuniibacter sp. 1_MG-2023]
MSQTDQQAAYVLHGRPYRDTSLLVDFFTLEYGKIPAVVQGARRPKSKLRASVQPFVPVQIGWRGRNELKTITQAEPVAAMMFLNGDALLCGLYVNELLSRTLQPFDPHPPLYVYYQYVLNELVSGKDIEGALRTFEHRLLDELGYLPELGNQQDEQIYLLDPEHGFSILSSRDISDKRKPFCFYGWQLNAISDDNYENPQVRRASKRLMRALIDRVLGYKPLRSRELFQKM